MSDVLSGFEILFRNVHPNDFDNGRVNSSCFDPSASHGFKLSLDRGAICTAQNSYERHVAGGLASVGVFGVLCSDFQEQSINCFADPRSINPAHALADYSAFGSGARRKKARKIAEAARRVGIQYSPTAK